MLEQAVIDAQALKEAAIKNAEQEVLGKYAGEIKEAVDSLLEQEEDPFAEEDPLLGGEEGAEEHEDVVDQLTGAAVDGERLCPCPETDEPVVLDLDQLVAAAGIASGEGEEEFEEEPAPEEEELFEVNKDNLMVAISEVLTEKEDKEDDDEKQTPEERAKDIKGDGESVKSELEDTPEDEKDDVLAALRKMDEGTRLKIIDKVFEDSGEEEERHYKSNREEDERHLSALKKDMESDDDAPGEDASEEEKEHYRRNREADKKHITNLEKDKRYDDEHEPLEEANLTDEQLNDILEALTVDIENVPSGMLFHTHPTKGESEYGLNVAIAKEQDTVYGEEQEELRQAIKKLQEQSKSQKLQLNKQKKDYNNLMSVTLKATEKLEEVNFSNAKLIYTNRILKSDSLNERQKDKLVEALSKVGSVEEAKIVFDTLKENLTSKGSNAPKTLNEAVSKNSQLILKSNKEKQPAGQNQIDRLKKLAGII